MEGNIFPWEGRRLAEQGAALARGWRTRQVMSMREEVPQSVGKVPGWPTKQNRKKKKKTLHFFLFFKSLHIKRIFKRGRRRRRRRTNKRKKREGERDIGIWRIETARGSCKSSWWVRRLRLAHDAWLRFPLKSRCVCKEDRTWGG